MTGDLGAGRSEVHAQAGEVLRFWFEETPADKHFAKDEALDAEIRSRFAKVRDAVLADGALGWRETPDHLLAAIILLDQFSRNLHRGDAAAFAADPLALELTRHAIAMEWEESYPPEGRAFLYLPLMHSEDSEVQELSLDRYEHLGITENLQFARAHADVIATYGRFPSRNEALGRTSTPAEQEYLSQPGAGW